MPRGQLIHCDRYVALTRGTATRPGGLLRERKRHERCAFVHGENGHDHAVQGASCSVLNQVISPAVTTPEADDRAVPSAQQLGQVTGLKVLGSSAIGDPHGPPASGFTILLHLPRMDDYEQPQDQERGPSPGRAHGRPTAVRDAMGSSIGTLPTQAAPVHDGHVTTSVPRWRNTFNVRIDTGLPIDFCTPTTSAWQRGTNENTYVLDVRQGWLYPKGTDLVLDTLVMILTARGWAGLSTGRTCGTLELEDSRGAAHGAGAILESHGGRACYDHLGSGQASMRPTRISACCATTGSSAP